MRCPYCKSTEDKVLDSRSSAEGNVIRRRRQCLKCSRRYTTYERVEERPLQVVKKNGSREPFDRQKILSGLMKACEKRPVPLSRLEDVVNRIELELRDRFVREVPSKRIGEMLMRELRQIDQVAYVRFASVYREFKDVSEFMVELKPMLE